MSTFCSGCGAPLNGAKFCVKCGKAAETQTQQASNGYRPAPVGLSSLNLNFKKIGYWAFWLGVLFMVIVGLIQFISGMVNIGDLSDELKDADASLLWILPHIIVSLLAIAGTVLVVMYRNHPLKLFFGIGAAAILFVLLLAFYIVSETADTNGFSIFCELSVDSMAAMVTFIVLSAVSFVTAKVSENM